MKRTQSEIFKNLNLWVFFVFISSLLLYEESSAVPLLETSISGVQKTISSVKERASYSEQWLCRRVSEVRTLRVEKRSEFCRGLYTKLGVEQAIVSSKSKENCLPIVEKVKTNLETAGWKCKDISGSLITE